MTRSYNSHAMGMQLACDGQHICNNISKFSLDKFFQRGANRGKKVLIVGESPALNGWIKSGKAFYTIDGKLVPSGRNLNKLLLQLGLSVDICGFTEIVKCFLGKNRKTIVECGKKCWPIFLKQLESEGKETGRVFNEILDNNFEIGKLSKVKISQRDYTPFNHKRNTEILMLLNNELNILLQ